MDANHTQTPWSIDASASGEDIIFGADGSVVAQTFGDNFPGNAVLIVDAVNARDDATTSDEDSAAYWKGAYERMAARNANMDRVLRDAAECLDGQPEYHYSGMGCGLEDRGITDRYEAMRHGWDCAMERLASEHVIPARDILRAALKATGG